MDSLTLTTTYPRISCRFNVTRRSNFNISRPLSFIAFAASKDEPTAKKFDTWEQMELKFGRLLGEDPKLTQAKIAGRKSNPDVSYLEIEKSFGRKKFEIDDEIVEEFQKRPPLDSLNLLRPVPKKGIKFEEDEFEERPPSSSLNLVRPVPKKGIKFQEDDNAKSFESQKSRARPSSVQDLAKVSSIPNVILRKPSAAYPEDDIEVKRYPRLNIKPNLSLKMSKGETKDNFSDITLLKRPEPTGSVINSETDDMISGNSIETKENFSDINMLNRPEPTRPVIVSETDKMTSGDSREIKENFNDITLLKRPAPTRVVTDFNTGSTLSGNSIGSTSVFTSDNNKDYYELLESNGPFLQGSKVEDESTVGLQPLEQSDLELNGKETSITQQEVEMQRKPPRLDHSPKDEPEPVKDKAAFLSTSTQAEIENFISAIPLQEREDADWSRAEYLCNTGGRQEVELISCSTRGFVASCGSLIGFLPYRNLGAKWKFLAFESWLRKKGLDPSKYRQKLGIVGPYESRDKNLPTGANLAPLLVEGKLSPNMKLEDLLEIYEQEKIKFLSSSVGLRIKVNVILADRSSRKLMFSGKPKEREESVQKKRSLMAQLNVGDVVKCCIKKITYFGIFVEVEGVPALIHQSEVSWDATLDPSSFFKVGQIVEAKVHQLDFALDRILLSLKEITPDPLIEALESVVGDKNHLEGSLAAQADIEWADVELLIKELEDVEGVQSVSKGRFFLSPGLAPTFQVYMASMFESQYKLLARSGNKVQEVIVQASLDKEDMKAAILVCTNRVE